MQSFLHSSRDSHAQREAQARVSYSFQPVPLDEQNSQEQRQGSAGKEQDKLPKIFTCSTIDSKNLLGWHDAPRTLHHTTAFSFLFAVGDLILALTPIAFVALGFCALRLHKQLQKDNEFGKDIEQAMKLGPSLFPIVFAAVAGRALKTTARFFAERGAKLGTLELLMASQTVWGTFESQVLLKTLSVVGVHLFLLWTLSPLGGQASLRVLEKAERTTNGTTEVVYLSTGGMRMEQVNYGTFSMGTTATQVAAVNSLYNSVLLAPIQIRNAEEDVWGNVKIPSIGRLDATKKDSDGWIESAEVRSSDDFTALVGLPIIGLPEDADSEIDITSAYMTLDCPIQYNISNQDPWWVAQLGAVWARNNGSGVFSDTKANKQTGFFLDSNLNVSGSRQDAVFKDTNATSEADPKLSSPRNILFGSQYYTPKDVDPTGGTSIVLRNCTVLQQYVDSRVHCTKGACKVRKMRQSVAYGKRNPNLTPLENPTILGNLFMNLPISTGKLHSGDATPTELLIRGASSPFQRLAFGTDGSTPAMRDIAKEVFETRLAQILNTYYQLSIAPYAFAGTKYDLDLFGPFRNGTMANGTFLSPTSDDLPFFSMPTTAVVMTTIPIYKCNFIWLACLEVASLVLLLVGAAGMLLNWRCRAPDMLGYVASMTYDNPYVALPPGGGVLGAMERAQVLKGVDVRIADVRPREQVGHVAFASAEGNGALGELKRDRLYI